MNLQETKEKLKRGDRKEVAELVGCSLVQVYAVFAERRSSYTDLGVKIMKVANDLIKSREQLKEKYQPA